MRRPLSLGVVAAAVALASAVPALSFTGPLDYLPSLAGDYFPLKSAVMGSVYRIFIRCPEGYADRAPRSYPIVYLLDGDSAFPMLAPEQLFLTYDDKLPDAIVVGIAYGSFQPPVNHREIDFGPRAAEFERFLRAELIPEVERRVRADPAKRILVGQSFGGNFILYSAMKDPDLFWARISSNPSARMYPELLTSRPAVSHRRDLHLYLVSGTANNQPGRDLAAAWQKKWQGASLPWTFEEIEIPGGTHAADLPNAYRAALRHLFASARSRGQPH